LKNYKKVLYIIKKAVIYDYINTTTILKGVIQMKKIYKINKAFINGFVCGFTGIMFGWLILFGIDAELCRQERENLQEQHCLFSINCRNI
jgi:hypothetical protein